MLGRADKIGDFVKRDSSIQYGKVEITLKGRREGETPVITRRINKRTNGSDWRINGKEVSQKQVEELVHSLNIQVGNLCQFLPQDKVVSFSAMKPHELLQETEKALGDSTLYQQHQELIAMRKDIRDVESSAENHAEKLERLKKQNAALERDVERNKERDAILAEVDLLKKKLPWLRYNEQKDVYLEAKEKAAEAKKNVAARAKEVQAADVPVASLTTRSKKVQDSQLDAKKRIHTLTKNRDRVQRALSASEDKVSEVTEELDAVKREAQNFDKRKADLEKKIEAIDHALANDPKLQVDAEATKEASNEKRKKAAEARAINEQISDIEQDLKDPQSKMAHLADKLKLIGSKRFKRVKALEKIGNPNAGSMAKWVQEGKRSNAFKGRVWGPLAAEVDIRPGKYARLYSNYLEQHVPRHLWGAYVTEEEADRDRLIAQMKQLQHKATVIRYTGDTGAPLDRKGPPDAFAADGVACTLDQVFEAPSIVKHVLQDNANITNAYCADDRVNWEQVSQGRTPVDGVLAKGVRCLFTPQSRIIQKGSNYNAQSISKEVNQIRPARIFTEVSSAAEEAALKKELAQLKEGCAELEGKLAEYKERRKKVEREEAQARKLQEALTKVHRERSTKEAQRKAAESKLAQMEPLNIERAEQEADAKLAKLATKQAEQALQLVGIVKEHMAALSAYDGAQLEKLELETHLDAAKEAKKTAQARMEKAESLQLELKAILQKEKANLKELQEIATAECELTDDLREKFASLPDTADDCKEAIAEGKRKADAVVLSNPDALAEYQRRTKEIKALERKTKDSQASYEAAKAEMDKIRSEWLPILRALVQRISDAYATNFARIGCCGEVRLEEAGDDYEQYAVAIFVKFRDNEKLVRLTSQRQSGGERSVSTMLYLLSLQSLTATPFRVVDEINQGMDPNNERKIHQLLCRAATAKGTPQCFVLTPKLLADLEYNDAVTVMCIFNGPWIADIAQGFSNQGFRKRIRAAA